VVGEAPLNPGASKFGVVIPTANRATFLAAMVDSILGGAKLPDEIIVVDQSSDERTRELIINLRIQFPIVRLIPDPGSGTSRAKNIGWRASRSDVICFTDDDAWVDKNWLAEIVRATETYPRFGVMGGRVLIPNLDENLPLKFPESGLGLMPWFDPPIPEGVFPPAAVPVGVNLVVQRATLEALNGFNEDLGPNYQRKVPLYGEEGDLCRRAKNLGLTVLYVPQAVVWHPLYPGRNSMSFFRRRAAQEFVTSACLVRGESGVSATLRQLLKASLHLVAVSAKFWRVDYSEIYFCLKEIQSLLFALFFTPVSLIHRQDSGLSR
jgi:GT2 family glycosyltransferase